MAHARTPRKRWIEEALRALAAGGPEAVRIEPLAKALGVTKGGFYGYFDDRRALLEETLDAWEQASIDDVIERVEGGGGDARDKLRRLFAGASSRQTRQLLKVDLAVRDWSRQDRGVATRLRRVDGRRMEYMRSLFADFCHEEAEVDARCMLTYALWVGTPLIAAEPGARTRREAIELAQTWLLT